MRSLEGKIALVTGASGVIGRSIAECLHGNAAHVVITGTNMGKLEEIRNKCKDRCDIFPCDFNDASQVTSLIKDIEQKLGRSIDILVNNAGIALDGLAMRMSDEAWERVMRINLQTPFQLIRSCLRPMIKSGWGRIINISSVVGVTGNAGQANYCASKAGIIGMSKSLAIEVASRGITVNCVAPGMIESPMVEKIPDERKQALLKFIPVGRMGTPEDVANCVLFLADPKSSYITGHVLHVNGGMAMV